MLNWGSRQAIRDVPVWATPRVLQGGFASGELLAQLQDTDFVANDYYLTPSGLLELSDLLDSGCYRLRVPEHGALLVVVWLLRNGKEEEANTIRKFYAQTKGVVCRDRGLTSSLFCVKQ